MIKIASNKRIICTINNQMTFHCAMNPKTTFHYIMISKEKLKQLDCKINNNVAVELIADTTEYGMHDCEELQEVLYADPDGNMLFEKLTSGKKRSLIYWISKIKNPELRIEKSFVLIEHLKRNRGKFDSRQYQDECREFRLKNSF